MIWPLEYSTSKYSATLNGKYVFTVFLAGGQIHMYLPVFEACPR